MNGLEEKLSKILWDMGIPHLLPEDLRKFEQAFKDAGWLKEIDISMPAVTNYDRPKAKQYAEDKGHLADDHKEIRLKVQQELVQELSSRIFERAKQVSNQPRASKWPELNPAGQNAHWYVDGLRWSAAIVNSAEYLAELEGYK